MPSALRALRVARLAVVPVAGALAIALLGFPAGCSSKSNNSFGDMGPTGSGGSDGGDDSSAPPDLFGDGGASSPPLSLDGSSATSSDTNDSACKGGFYFGQFGGLYSSHITVFGINIPVTGDVQLTLHQEGSGQQTCMLEGEADKCSDVFSLQNGVITGTADNLFPYFCTLTGTLACSQKKLVGGWINCTYCLGPLNDGGLSCALGGSGNAEDGGSAGIGGYFAGPLTSDYFYTSTGGDGGAGAIDGGGKGPPSFGTIPPPAGATNLSDYDPGMWNGAESLGSYTGTGPLPDGGTLGNYLSDAGYGRIGVSMDFGGDGWWYAVYQPSGLLPDGGMPYQ